MHERGFIKDTSFEVETISDDMQFTAYIGFDLTAPSLHVGSLIQLMVLRWLQKEGHRPIALLGEATTRIGDPSGKDASRPMMTIPEIADNRSGIAATIRQIVPDIELVTNDDWFEASRPSFMEFITEYGPHFTINRMMTFDSVKRRLDGQSPLTFLEFCYMLLQAVDFRELHNRIGVNMQIGGSDQWGNIVNGLEIIRRKDGDEVFAMTTPLLLDSEGSKMGKSQGKPVWLDPVMTSPFDFFQFWRNVDDADVERFLLLFTEQSVDWCHDMVTPVKNNEPRDINKAKAELAFLVTEIVHGTELAKLAWEQSRTLFEQNELVATETISAIPGSTLVEIMILTNNAKSKSAAKRLLIQNGVAVDGQKATQDFVPENDFILRVGKRAPVKVVL